MAKILKYQDLLVWQKADEFAFLVYKIVAKFPKEELYALTSQLKRAALSVPTNIVEGFGRHSRKEFIQFLYISLGSLYESDYQIYFAHKNNYIPNSDFSLLTGKIEEIGKLLNGLIRSLK